MPFAFIQNYYDRDALAYIRKVEEADNQALEVGVKRALNDFVTGLKTDNLWNSIDAACIMMGARTLLGCLIPLKGPSPTSYNFISSDYNRTTGLRAVSRNEYLDTNILDDTLTPNNIHIGVYFSERFAAEALITARNTTTPNGTVQIYNTSGPSIISLNRSTTGASVGGTAPSFIVSSRTSSSNFQTITQNRTTANFNFGSQNVDTDVNFEIFRRFASGIYTYSSHRISYYTIGKGISTSSNFSNLLNYESRVETLKNTITSVLS
jgi:hypothetical protein